MEDEVSIRSLARRLINTYKARKWSRTKLYLRKIKKSKRPVVKSEVVLTPHRTDDEDCKVYRYERAESNQNLYTNDKAVNICTCRSCPCASRTARCEIVDDITTEQKKPKPSSRIIICIRPKSKETNDDKDPNCCIDRPKPFKGTQKNDNRHFECQCCFSDSAIPQKANQKGCQCSPPSPKPVRVGCQCGDLRTKSPPKPDSRKLRYECICHPPPSCCVCNSPITSPSPSWDSSPPQDYCCCKPPECCSCDSQPSTPPDYCCCKPPEPSQCCPCDSEPSTPPEYCCCKPPEPSQCCPCDSEPSTPPDYCCCKPPSPPECCSCDSQPPTPQDSCCCNPPSPPECCSCDSQPPAPQDYCCCEPPTPPECCSCDTEPSTPPDYCCCKPPTPPECCSCESQPPTPPDYCRCNTSTRPCCCACDSSSFQGCHCYQAPSRPQRPRAPQRSCCHKPVGRYYQYQLFSDNSNQKRGDKIDFGNCTQTTVDRVIIPTYFNEEHRDLSYGISRSEEIRNVLLNDSIAERMKIEVAINSHKNQENPCELCPNCGKAKSKTKKLTNSDKKHKTPEHHSKPQHQQNVEHHPKQNSGDRSKQQQQSVEHHSKQNSGDRSKQQQQSVEHHSKQNSGDRSKQQQISVEHHSKQQRQHNIEQYPKTHHKQKSSREKTSEYESHLPCTCNIKQHGSSRSRTPSGERYKKRPSSKEQYRSRSRSPYKNKICPAGVCCKCKSYERKSEGVGSGQDIKINTSCVVIKTCTSSQEKMSKAEVGHSQDKAAHKKSESPKETATTCIVVQTCSSLTRRSKPASQDFKSQSRPLSTERTCTCQASTQKAHPPPAPHHPTAPARQPLCPASSKTAPQTNECAVRPVPSPMDFEGYSMATCFNQLLGDGDRLTGINDKTKREVIGLLNKLDRTLQREANMHNQNMRGIIDQICKQASELKQLKVLVQGVVDEKKTPTCLTVEKKLNKITKNREKQEDKRMKADEKPKEKGKGKNSGKGKGIDSGKTSETATANGSEVCCRCRSGMKETPNIGCCGQCCGECCCGCCGRCCGGCCVNCCDGCCGPCEKCCPGCCCWCAKCCGGCFGCMWCRKKKFKCQ